MATNKDGLYAMKEYERSASDEVTSSTKGYLEVVCRIEGEGESIRVGSLITSLHIRPSSASKMLDSLRKAGYIDFERHGSIMVTDKKYEEGRYLLHKHRVLQDFFCTLNRTKDELELVEKIKHSVNHKTAENIEQAPSFLRHKNDMTGKMG